MSKDTRTYADRREYLIKAVSLRRKRLKEMAIEYKGGQCMFCGYAKYAGALDFHHLEPGKKDFGLSLNGLTRSWEKIQTELDKCVLVCSNCHREIHAGILQPSLVMKNGNTG
ncbi:MAG TPA: HNH endonuclease signature motif containing protein [Candidatus Saccharimonadia bacterium]|nr:HNH endonuclease signature motif containing protein [Candidatus Saccharimonadia bacterium]